VKRPFRKAIALLAVGALSFGLSACGDDDDGGQGSDTTGPGAPSATENDVNTTAREQLQDGGTLQWAVSQVPPNFNYFHLDGTLRDNFEIVDAMLPSMFNADAKAELHVDPDYAESAEITATTPKQVVTYKLNRNAVWYDGTPVTVADFEAQWRAVNGTNEAFTISASQGYEDIESVEQGADEYEVVVTFANPYADWKGLFAPLIPASTSSDPDVFNEGWIDQPLTSAGPFKLEAVDKTAQTVTLVRNEKWWGAPAKLEKVIYRAIDLDAQVDALANGEIDFIDIGPDVDKLRRAESTPGIEIRRAGGPNFRHITINGTGEILKDVKVRHALALAIDRETIARALLGPLGGEAVPLNNHIFMSNQIGYQSNAGDLEKADPEKAAAELEAAGWTLQSGSDVRTKAGKPLEIRFVIPSQVATSKQESELIQGMLAAIGVKVNIQTVPSPDFFDKYITPGDFDFTVFSWIGTAFPISSSQSIYANPKETPEGLDIQQNYARVGSPEIDALFDQATAEFDEVKAREIANQIDRAIWEEVHSLTNYQRPDLVGAKAGLANMGALGFADIDWPNLGFTA
jgi:peptide/nickel transport system substrate-binding protein